MSQDSTARAESSAYDQVVNVRGLTFTVSVGGPADGGPVLLLHGFPQDHREFDLIRPGLHNAGLRTLTYDQRGWTPDARPAEVAAYVVPEAVADAIAILDALGIDSAHVVGTSRGSEVGWHLAASHPDRVRTFTAVGGPNPLAFAEAAARDPRQERQLDYQSILAGPDAEAAVMGNGAAWMWQALKPIGDRAGMYVESMLNDPGRVTGTVNWYRADHQFDNPMPATPITAPTTLVWGTRDFVASRAAVDATAQWVAGDFRLVVLEGVSHWVPEEAPDALVAAIVDRVTWTVSEQ